MQYNEAALKALLTCLIDPTPQHTKTYLATCKEITNDQETQRDQYRLNDLCARNYLHWVDLYNEVIEFPSLIALYEEAEKVNKIWVEKIEAHMTT